jgi:hypothetical protein
MRRSQKDVQHPKRTIRPKIPKCKSHQSWAPPTTTVAFKTTPPQQKKTHNCWALRFNCSRNSESATWPRQALGAGSLGLASPSAPPCASPSVAPGHDASTAKSWAWNRWTVKPLKSRNGSRTFTIQSIMRLGNSWQLLHSPFNEEYTDSCWTNLDNANLILETSENPNHWRTKICKIAGHPSSHSVLVALWQYPSLPPRSLVSPQASPGEDTAARGDFLAVPRSWDVVVTW